MVFPASLGVLAKVLESMQDSGGSMGSGARLPAPQPGAIIPSPRTMRMAYPLHASVSSSVGTTNHNYLIKLLGGKVNPHI